jgi:hypothetical protein
MTWASFFPKDCPPADARAASGLFFRVVPDSKKRPLKPKDFYSHKRKQPNRNWPPDKCVCSLCGVSVTQTIEDAIKFARYLLIIPAYSNKICFIANGHLEEHMGLIRHTPDLVNNLQSHHDWWIPDECDPCPNFKYCEEQVENSSQG